MATTAVAEHVGGPQHQYGVAPVLAPAPAPVERADDAKRLRGAMLVATILCLQLAWVGAILYAAWVVVF